VIHSSCGSNLTIAKRHYNSGYYFSHNTGNKNIYKQTNEDENIAIKTIEPINVSVEPKEFSKKYVHQNSKSNDVFNSDRNIETSFKTISTKNSNQLSKPKITSIKTSVKEIKQTLLERKITSTTTVERDGLSLFWIIIVVILILWLLGFLAGGFGLGGLINLLLLIALILLILWLLRIV
jgi:hypothetical protein